MELIIHENGNVRCIYDESIDLHQIGPLTVQRASHVEPDENGHWYADLSPVAGPIFGPFKHRSDALTAEINWLRSHWLDRA